MAKIGRNDSCWCGSGKKYKNCHLRLEQAQQSNQVQQERAYQSLDNKLIEWSREIRGEGDFEAAYDLYWNNRMDVAEPGKLPAARLREFFDYYIFDYQTAEDGRTIADLVAERRRAQLNPFEQRMLEQWRGSYRSLFKIKEIGSASATLQDLLQGSEVTTDDRFPPDAVPGLALIGRVLQVGERKHLAPAVMPVPAELVEPMVAYMQRQYGLYQERWIGRPWSQFLHERSYLFNYFLLQQVPPEAVVTPKADAEDQLAREVLREVQNAIIVGPLDQHYARWIDKPVSAWGNRTPRQMMAQERDRQRVEAVLDLLEEAEVVKHASGQPAYDVNRLRALLGFEQALPIGGGRLVG